MRSLNFVQRYVFLSELKITKEAHLKVSSLLFIILRHLVFYMKSELRVHHTNVSSVDFILATPKKGVSDAATSASIIL